MHTKATRHWYIFSIEMRQTCTGVIVQTQNEQPKKVAKLRIK